MQCHRIHGATNTVSQATMSSNSIADKAEYLEKVLVHPETSINLCVAVPSALYAAVSSCRIKAHARTSFLGKLWNAKRCPGLNHLEKEVPSHQATWNLTFRRFAGFLQRKMVQARAPRTSGSMRKRWEGSILLQRTQHPASD